MTAPGRAYLRQAEVDAVFGIVEPAAEVRPYDFHAPPPLARERRGALAAALESFANTTAAALGTRLGRPVRVTCGEVETARPADFVSSLPSPCACVGLESGGQRLLFDVGAPFAFLVVDRMFGGGEVAPPPARPLTALERAAAGHVVGRILDGLRECLHLPPGTPAAIECDPERLAPAPGGADVVIARLQWSLDAAAGEWAVAAPLPALSRLFERDAPAGSPPPPPSSDNLVPLQAARVELRARLPVFRARARELAALSPGGLLPTGLGSDSPVTILVNGSERFRGAVGQRQGRLGIRISERVGASRPAPYLNEPEGRSS